jgi:hypothetical protein
LFRLRLREKQMERYRSYGKHCANGRGRLRKICHGRKTYLIQHSPNGRWFQSSLRHFGVPGKLGAPPTSSRRVLGHAESERRAGNAGFVVIQTHLPWFLIEPKTIERTPGHFYRSVNEMPVKLKLKFALPE